MKGGSSSSSSWLCPSELDRARVIDASDRVRTIRRVGSGAIGLALLAVAPWIGWWTLGLLALCALNFANVERRIRTSPRPERVSAWTIAITLGLLGAGVALSGGPREPGAAVDGAAGRDGRRTRFRPQVVIAAPTLTVMAIVAAPLGVDPSATIADPVDAIAVLALLASVVSIVWALQSAELHHRDEAILDPLTGLLNRHALVPRFVEISLQARLTGQPVSLVLCDVDAFKQVNDEHGHDRGDAVLRDIAYELRKRLRSFELVYRLGGEEFLIVLPGIGLEGGAITAERLREAVEEAQPKDIPVTISLGVSSASGTAVDYDELFRAADTALYQAKRAGRNRVVAATVLRRCPADRPPSRSSPTRAPISAARSTKSCLRRRTSARNAISPSCRTACVPPVVRTRARMSSTPAPAPPSRSSAVAVGAVPPLRERPGVGGARRALPGDRGDTHLRDLFAADPRARGAADRRRARGFIWTTPRTGSPTRRSRCCWRWPSSRGSQSARGRCSRASGSTSRRIARCCTSRCACPSERR